MDKFKLGSNSPLNIKNKYLKANIIIIICILINVSAVAQNKNFDFYKNKQFVFTIFKDSIYSIRYETSISAEWPLILYLSSGSFTKYKNGYLATDKDFRFQFSFKIVDSTVCIGNIGLYFLRNMCFDYIGSKPAHRSLYKDYVFNPRIQYIPHYIKTDTDSIKQVEPGYWVIKYIGSDDHRADLYLDEDQSYEYYQVDKLISKGLWRQVGKKIYLTDNELDQTFTLIIYKGDLVTYSLPCFYKLEEFKYVECK